MRESTLEGHEFTKSFSQKRETIAMVNKHIFVLHTFPQKQIDKINGVFFRIIITNNKVLYFFGALFLLNKL